MKARELREMTTKELKRKVEELKGELFNLRFRQATGQLDNPMRIRQVKKDIARINTLTGRKGRIGGDGKHATSRQEEGAHGNGRQQ